MSDSTASLGRKINNATELEAVVRTMKAMAASSINQYERAVEALEHYDRTVELGLATCLRQNAHLIHPTPTAANRQSVTGLVVFGSDQGLVGQFNDEVADFSMQLLQQFSGASHIWAVGERVQLRLSSLGFKSVELFAVPNSMQAITPLIGRILKEIETQREKRQLEQVYIVHNRPKTGALYEPISQRLLPLDAIWQGDLLARRWPTQNLPEVIGTPATTLSVLVQEYLFVSLFRACTESLASENASRLAAMQRAEKNIDEMLVDLNLSYHRLRQNNIDAELFDVVSGFEALMVGKG
jgi:F-type H+-transporting ATPase subunit gamma